LTPTPTCVVGEVWPSTYRSGLRVASQTSQTFSVQYTTGCCPSASRMAASPDTPPPRIPRHPVVTQPCRFESYIAHPSKEPRACLQCALVSRHARLCWCVLNTSTYPMPCRFRGTRDLRGNSGDCTSTVRPSPSQRWYGSVPAARALAGWVVACVALTKRAWATWRRSATGACGSADAPVHPLHSSFHTVAPRCAPSPVSACERAWRSP